MTLRTKVLLEAADLLDSNLVWSDDFEQIRLSLGLWLRAESVKGEQASMFAGLIAEKLVADA